MIWGAKCHQNNSSVVCDGYVKYEQAKGDRLAAILKTNNCGGGLCGIQCTDDSVRVGDMEWWVIESVFLHSADKRFCHV